MMKSDLIKLILLVWMVFMAYFMYSMWADLNYMTDLVHAYIKMTLGHVGH